MVEEKIEEGEKEEKEENSEEKEENSEEKPVKITKKVKERENRQLMWIVGFVILIIVVFVVFYFYFQSPKTFEFAGIEWDYTDYEGVMFYHSMFGFPQEYNLYLRFDPRENDIPIYTQFKFYDKVFVSIDSDAGECQGGNMGNYMLGQFLGGIGMGFDVVGASSDAKLANETGVAFANCSTAEEGTTVVLIKKSTSPAIDRKVGTHCYIIEVGECENLKAVERFIVGNIAQMTETEI